MNVYPVDLCSYYPLSISGTKHSRLVIGLFLTQDELINKSLSSFVSVDTVVVFFDGDVGPNLQVTLTVVSIRACDG